MPKSQGGISRTSEVARKRAVNSAAPLMRKPREALPFLLPDAIRVLRVEAHLAVLIHYLWMKTEDHVLPQRDVAVRADGGMLDHSHADGMSGQMAQPEAAPLENPRGGTMNVAGQLAFAHQDPRRFHGLRIDFAHGQRAGTDAPANQRAGELHPIAFGAGDFERIEKQVVRSHGAKRRHFEMRFGLAISSAQKNIHHARPGAARKEILDSGGHNLR